jgi:tetratricopeptide (TPR) repeat protein
MGLLSDRRINRAIDVAYDALDQGQDQPFAIMEELDDDERLPAFLGLAERLIDEEAYDHARRVVERTLELAPDSWDALGLLVQAERHDPERRPQAIAALRRMLAADPGNADVAADLAMLLTENQQAEEALVLLRGLEDKTSPAVILRTGEALVALGRHEEALTALSEVRQLYNYRLKHGMLHGDAYEMREHMLGAARLYQEIQEELHGREAVVTEDDGEGEGKHAADGEVDFVHLGNALMATSPRLARDLELRSPQATIDVAESRLEADDQDAGALALLGSAHLRLGDLESARLRFETCCNTNRKYFAGYLGLGAVVDCARFDLFGVAESLPAVSRKLAAPTVAPDWSALTELERRVVWAAVQPLRCALGALASAGTLIRVLPMDVRAADLEPGAAAVRVERLIDVESPDGWAFARELARLTHPHLPAEVRARVAALRAQALEAGWGTKEQPLEDDAGFFAVAYTDFLRQRHGLAEYRDPAEAGPYHEVMALFAALADRETMGA